MITNDVPLIAGSASTVIFVTSYMPMLVKAVRTKDLSSYSPTQLVLTNFGNVLYSAYVFSLPVGPIWALHCFYLVATALMLAWYFRYRRGRGDQSAPSTSSLGWARGVDSKPSDGAHGDVRHLGLTFSSPH